ncbi:MAG: translocation/assembly module TamB [Bacteroidota bacterium]
MSKAISVLKKIFKLILWVVISVVLLFILIAVLIQIPAVQTKVINAATSFISDKTHTRVELKKINISFPKSVVIEGLYLEDIKKDTLLYIGEVRVDIAFKDLINKKINISSLALEEVNLNVNRLETDTLFNYNFLLTAFSDTTKVEKVEPKKESSWTFGVDKVNLKNIRLHYDDNYGGTNAAIDLKHLNLKMDKIDLAQSIYSIDELLIDNLTASVLIKKSETKEEKKSESILPKITANKIHINNTNFIYGDSVGKQSLITTINTFKLKNTTLDLEKQIVNLEKIGLSKSKITFNTTDKAVSEKPVASSDTLKEQSDWKVSVNKIDLDDNSFAYMVVNKPEIQRSFDASHLDYKHLTLEVENLKYSADKTEASIKKFAAEDKKNNFKITKFETDFSMDQHSITAKKLKVKTGNSSINADLGLQYSSLQSLQDSIQFMIVNADLKKVSIQNSDILYFSPQLIKQAFFKSGMNTTNVSGLITGPVNNLKGENVVIQTGVTTILKTDFIIAGLPDANAAYFNFPDLKIYTGKKDIAMMAGPSVPKSIELPENISMQIVFKGKLKSFESTVGISTSYGSAHLFATIDKNENFKSKVNISNFDLGSLLKNKEMFGPVSLTAETNGQGLDKNTIKAKVKVEVSQIYLNKYTYHDLKVNGDITGQQFDGKIKLDDENAAFDFDGLVNLSPDQENYKFHLNLTGANLQKLNITKEDLRIGLTAESNLKGGSAAKLNGNARINNIIIVHEGKKHVLDSFLVASINEPNKSDLKVSGALIGLNYTGTLSPDALPKVLTKFINNYFPFSDSVNLKKDPKAHNFNFDIQLHNHPIISEVFLPELKEFEPGLIQGSFDSQKNELKLSAAMRKIVYGTTEINDLAVDVISDVNELNYKISCRNVLNAQIKLENLVVDGKLADKKIFANVSSIDSAQNKKLLIRSQIVKNKENYKLTLDPHDFYLMNDRWDIASDNYIEFGKQGFLIHHLFLNKTESQINVASVHDQFNDDLNIAIKNFKLDDISGIIEKDTSLIKGNVDGNILLKRVNDTYGIIADAKISNLIVREVPIGNLSLKAENPTTEKFNIDLNLSGVDNNLRASGYFVPKGGNNSIHIEATIQSLSMKTAEAFSMGKISESSGNLTGKFLIEGSSESPEVTGELTFNNVLIKPAVLNNLLQLKHETVLLKKDGIYFNSFTILDPDQHTAIIDGAVKMKNFKDFIFELNLNTKDFMLFNTTAKENKEFYGRMIIDSKIDVKGPMTLPVVNAKLKMKKGSTFTFAVPEKKLTTDKGEDIVEFDAPEKLNPILYGENKKEKQKSGLVGFDISSIIEIDKQATLRLLMDPTSSDSLVVKGEAALNFTIDRSGKMSLTGAYNLNDGSYIVSLESVIKKKFMIDPGSTIIWSGDLLDAEISINAIYSVRASPIDLVADQMSGLSEADKNAYKQRYPFLVYLKLRGEISRPEISFEIQLPPEDKGILGGAVNAKLNMLNEDPSALNKQVFALLVLGRFVQENPLQTETNGVSTAARTTVGKFLSAQLNQLSSKVVPGVELNFDVQSYDDYQTGEAEGRTQVDIGVKKQLFNERLTVQVGGVVDVEGASAKQNSASDITSDVTLEYKMTKDGRYRLKGFRHNQYEGAIEGQLVETGAGVLYVRDFNKWKEFFRSPKMQIDSSKKINNNDTINHK